MEVDRFEAAVIKPFSFLEKQYRFSRTRTELRDSQDVQDTVVAVPYVSDRVGLEVQFRPGESLITCVLYELESGRRPARLSYYGQAGYARAVNLDLYEGVVIVSPVYFGGHSAKIMRFLRKRRASLKELVEHMKKNPGKLLCGTYGIASPPHLALELLKKEAGIEKGSGAPNRTKVGSVTKAQVRKIAEIKLPDLNTDNIDSAMAMVAGAARSMGLEVKD